MAQLSEMLSHGQSIWLDYIDRNLLTRGGLQRLVEIGVTGVTSNPSIFYKAITSSDDYDDTIADLMQVDPAISDERLCEWLMVHDVKQACEILRPVYDATQGADGYVSLEVSPRLAYDTAATLTAARHLWKAVDHANLMIKVPGTREGLPAIEALIAEGINVNITLLFGVARYEEVVLAYARGLARNAQPSRVASVASFFISRVDGKVDKRLAQIGTHTAQGLQGKIAIANAKLAYQSFKRLCKLEPLAKQLQRGARVQRPLWGSTSTKNPAYRDVLYLEQLVGPHTVNTVPPEVLDAFIYHGEVRYTLEENVDHARAALEHLAELDVNLDEITAQLEREGVASFAEAYDKLLAALKEKRFKLAGRFAG